MSVQIDGVSAHAIECTIPGTNIEMLLDLPRSRGAWFCESNTGIDYLDLTGLFGKRALGFNHRVLKECQGAADQTLVKLRERMMLSPMAQGFAELKLLDSGDTALAYAVSLAIERRGQNSEVIHFSGSRHESENHSSMDHVPVVACPSVPSAAGPGIQGTTEEEATALESLMQASRDADAGIAAVVVESVQGSLGDHYLRPEFFQALRALCNACDALLVVDEVESGFGRSGCWWDCEHLGARPDMIVFGGIAQLGGVLIGEHLSRWLFETESAALPSSQQIMRCNAVLDAMEDEKLVNHADLMGHYLDRVLTELAMKFPAVNNSRARGLRAAFDLPSREERDALILACLDEHLIVLPSGVRSIALRPTLDVRPDAIGRGVAQLEAALRRVYG